MGFEILDTCDNAPNGIFGKINTYWYAQEDILVSQNWTDFIWHYSLL